MNKKVLTLLPIFSMFALASCGGGSSSGTQYCLLDFDSDGGTHVSAMKIAVGTKIESVDNPTKKIDDFEYTFDGWYKGSAKFTFPAVINEDTTLKAKWSGTPPTPGEKTEEVNKNTFKAKADLVCSPGFIEDKYLGKAEINEGGTISNPIVIGVTESSGTYRIDTQSTSILEGEYILNSAAVDILANPTFKYYITYMGADLATGVITKFSMQGIDYSDTCIYEHDAHCAPIKSVVMGTTTTYAYNVD